MVSAFRDIPTASVVFSIGIFKIGLQPPIEVICRSPFSASVRIVLLRMCAPESIDTPETQLRHVIQSQQCVF